LLSFSKWSKTIESGKIVQKNHCMTKKHVVIDNVTTLLWVKWEDETPTPKVRDLESSGTPKCLELDSKAQNTSH
jgi:hypothetical protein